METVLLISMATVLYTYVGHPLLLYSLAAVRPRPWARSDALHSISVFVSAFNEEAVLEKKIDNLLGQDYAGDVEIIIASDGSSDRTAQIARRFEASHAGVRLFDFAENRGKSAMQNEIVPQLDSDIVIFSDATSMWYPDTLRKIARNFADPEVGCFGADLVFVRQTEGGVEKGQGAYWRYESKLREWGALASTNVVVSGTCYAMRREYFRQVPLEVGEDLANPLTVVAAGGRVVFDPQVAVEEVSNVTHESEVRMRLRVAIQNTASSFKYWRLLHPRHGLGAYQLFAHKYLRVFCWVPLTTALVLSALLAGRAPYGLLLAAQIGFYGLAAFGLWCQKRGISSRVAYGPYYFSLLNFAYAAALVQFARGQQRATWDPER